MATPDPQEQCVRAYDEYADALFRFCLLKVADRDTARDLVQDTFARTWEYIRAGNEIDNMRAFLYRVLRNRIVDSYKKHRPLYEHQMGDEAFMANVAGIDTADTQAELSRVTACMRELGEQEREVVTLRYVEEYGVKDVAEIVGARQNTVSVWINRALKTLRACLGIA